MVVTAVHRSAEYSHTVTPGQPLRQVVAAMRAALAAGQAVTVSFHRDTLTTQEAADVLGVSRPTLVRLLEDGEIPYEQPGRHRRVQLQDVLDFQERRRHSAPYRVERPSR
jgi:excisionase family DNA binding protein